MKINNKSLDKGSMTHGIVFKPRNRINKVQSKIVTNLWSFRIPGMQNRAIKKQNYWMNL